MRLRSWPAGCADGAHDLTRDPGIAAEGDYASRGRYRATGRRAASGVRLFLIVVREVLDELLEHFEAVVAGAGLRFG
jgi:hypothetical protein